MAFPPTATLAQSACPSVPTWTSFHDPVTGGSLVSPSLVQGESANLRAKLAEAITRSDLNARYGGGGWGVIPGPSGTGCNLSAGSGLTLNIAAGHVLCDGVVEVDAQTATLTNNIARVYIWISRAGAISQVNNSLTPPAGAQVFLGSAVTSGGVITSVDFSGVVYCVGGGGAGFHRFTTDTSVPGDTPPSTISFIHHGNGRVWLWDGADYWLISTGTAGGGTAHSNVAITGDYTLSAGEAASSTLTLTDGGVSARFVLTFPTAYITAGQSWRVRNLTDEGAQIKAQGGSSIIYLQSTVNGCQTEFWYDGAELRESSRRPHVLDGLDWTLSGSTTFSQWEDVGAADHINFELSTDSTALFPTAGALANIGRRICIENGDSTTDKLNVRTNGVTTGDNSQNHLLPGEMLLFTVNSAGELARVPTRPYTRRVIVNLPTDANLTVVYSDFLAYRIVVTSTGALTATRDLILPLIDDHTWSVVNQTTGGQSIRVIGSSGTGVTITNGSVQVVSCDGANFHPDGAAATY